MSIATRRRLHAGTALARLGVLAAAVALLGAAPIHRPGPDRPSARVQKLVKAMTLDEKVALITGTHDPDYRGQSGYAPGVPRLGVPAMRWANGPTGIEAKADATAVPQAIGLAATFDTAAAYRFGELTGADARALGMDVVNGPQVDIARLPNWGRNATALGEDPLLSGELGAAEIRGIQSKGVLATAKHYIAYNQAQHVQGADAYDFVVDRRTMHEIYLPSFEAAARAGVASYMASYNSTNGSFNSENFANLTGILRQELGWDGYVVSDWNATHSVKALGAGLDVEMPGYGIQGGGERPYFYGDHLAADVRAGRASEADVDRAAARLLTQMERFGFLDGKRVAGPKAIDVVGDARIARDVATEGAVLLKNDGVLPLKAADLASVALIGPTAGQLAVGPGNGRAFGFEAREVSPVNALRRTASGSSVTFAVGDDQTGVAIPAAVLTPDGAQGRGLTRTPKGGQPSVDQTLDFTGGRALPAKLDQAWAGSLTPPSTGEYLLMVQCWGGSAVLKLDGQQVASCAKVPFHGFPRKWTSLLPTTDSLDNGQSLTRLEGGRSYKVGVEMLGDTDAPVQIRLSWVTPEMRARNTAEAVAAAKAAKTAIVFAWGRSGELVNPEDNLLLPGAQNALIEAVVAANPNTIVVLNSGGPVRMPWLDKVRAVLEMWYPGQEGGWATADLLTGRANPAGRLPITFPVRMEDTPAGAPGHPERYAGADKKVVYSEGIFVGYRHYDQAGIAPLFPFGYGLSYTRFGYSGLKVSRAAGGLDVAFTVKNAGKVAGSDAPQVYLGPDATAGVPMAPKALAGFARVSLKPGEAKAVRIHVPARQLAYWSEARHGWTPTRGPRAVYVGASSRDIRLTGKTGGAG